MESINYELKYCERCGTLKLRQVASASTYCRRCEGLLARFTFVRSSDGMNSGAKRALPALRMTGMAEASRLAGRVQ